MSTLISKPTNTLKLITLNLWGGYVIEPLLNFIADNKDVDIFCFQELYHNAEHEISSDGKKLTLDLLARLQKKLPKHQSFFRPVVNNWYGIGAMVKKDLLVMEEGEITIHENINYIGAGPTHSRNLQWLKIAKDTHSFSVVNVHGLWNGKGKNDSPDRIAQSHKIRNFLNTIDAPTILCGDFNLNPETESLSIIAQNMRNLIKEHNITSTRTNLYPKPERFADYIFTTHEIKIEKFAVMTDVVSDHSPLFLKFSF